MPEAVPADAHQIKKDLEIILVGDCPKKAFWEAICEQIGGGR